MYSFKEKKRHFVDLKNAAAAESDLLLLMSKVKQVSPSWRRQPRRYADDILYRLLDVATREEIRIHRRERMKDGPSTSVDNPVPIEGSEIDGHDESLQKTGAESQKRISESESAIEQANGRAEEAEVARIEAEERAEEAEVARIEAEERAEEAEVRAEEAEAALEEEKKKEPKQVKPT